MITEKQLELIEDKYGRLIHKISNWISGDSMISSHEDNVQDLWIAVIEAVRGYSRKEDMSFDDFWGSQGFDKYLKTCLWNLKNNKGAKITKKYPVTKNKLSLHINPEFLQIADAPSSCGEFSLFLEEFVGLLTCEEEKVLDELVGSPAHFKPSGKANVSSLSRELGKTWEETKAIISSIGAKLRNEL